MKLTLKHFEKFKKYCKDYQKELDLRGWDIIYEFKPLGDNRAQTAFNLEGSMATIALDTTWSDKVVPYTDAALKETALHEMLHVFLARVSELARYRFLTHRELDAAEHEVIQKLITKFNA